MSLETDQQHVLALLQELYERFGPDAVQGVVVRRQAKHPSNGFVTHVQNPESDGPGVRRCAVAGCAGRVFSKHIYCTTHRLRLQRTGDPTLARKRGPKKRESK